MGMEHKIKLFQYIFIIFLLFIVLGCARTRGEIDGKKELWSYGNFCGPNYPKTDDLRDDEKVIERLATGQPVDSIDIACQEHDICYVKNGPHTYSCDHDLKRKLNSMNFGDDELASACRKVNNQIYIAFFCMPHFSYNEEHYDPFADIAELITYTTIGAPGCALLVGNELWALSIDLPPGVAGNCNDKNMQH